MLCAPCARVCAVGFAGSSLAHVEPSCWQLGLEHQGWRGSSASPTAPAPCLQLPPALAWHAGSLAAPTRLSGCPHPPLAFSFQFFQAHTLLRRLSCCFWNQGGVEHDAAPGRCWAQGHGAARSSPVLPSPPQSSHCSSGCAGLTQRGGAPAVPGQPCTEPPLPPALWQVEESPGSWGRGSGGCPCIVSHLGSCLQQGLGPSVYGCCGLTGS